MADDPTSEGKEPEKKRVKKAAQSAPAKGEDGFLGRWARRKQAERRGAPEADPVVAAEAAAKTRAETAKASATAEELSLLPEAEALEKLGLPDPDTLWLGDDFKRYMAKQVPQAIRRRALRQLWRSNPVLANLDGLNDYDTDFTNAATDAPNLISSYKVGRGLLDQAGPPRGFDEDFAEETAEESTVEIAAEAEDDHADATDSPQEAETADLARKATGADASAQARVASDVAVVSERSIGVIAHNAPNENPQTMENTQKSSDMPRNPVHRMRFTTDS